MEQQIRHVNCIDILIKKGDGIPLSKFRDVNTLIGNDTIVSMLYRLCKIRNLRPFGDPEYGHVDISDEDVRNNLHVNIINLLSHPDIDFSIPANKNTLVSMIIKARMVFYKPGLYMFASNNAMDKIFKIHKINPDILVGGNSILKLLKNVSYCDSVDRRINIFIKHGANIELNVIYDIDRQPYMLYLNNSGMLNTILFHTKNFYCLGDGIKKHSKKMIPIFEHILQHGKISSLRYLHAKEYENVKIYDDWLRQIRYINFDIETMRKHFSIPIKHFVIINQDIDINDIVQKMCIFKQNLECLMKSSISIPAYRFYDIAIIILFLMKNPSLIVLPQDVLRKIGSFAFN